MPQDLLSLATIRAYYDYAAADLTVGKIAGGLEDAAFTRQSVPEASLKAGQRRQELQAFLAGIDLTSHAQVKRLLDVIEYHLLLPPYGPDRTSAAYIHFVRRLEQDGYPLSEDGKLGRSGFSSPTAHLQEQHLSEATIRDHIEYLDDRLAAEDVRGVLGGVKDLLETTCRLTLSTLQQPWDERDDLADLIKRTQKALHVHIDALTPASEVQEPVKRVLGGLSQMALGCVEIRNREGRGHGRTAPTALGMRHAALCLGAGTTWTRFILDCLHDERAPWQTAATTTASS